MDSRNYGYSYGYCHSKSNGWTIANRWHSQIQTQTQTFLRLTSVVFGGKSLHEHQSVACARGSAGVLDRGVDAHALDDLDWTPECEAVDLVTGQPGNCHQPARWFSESVRCGCTRLWCDDHRRRYARPPWTDVISCARHKVITAVIVRPL